MCDYMYIQNAINKICYRRLISYLVAKSDKNFKTFFNEEKLVDRPYYQK